MISLTLFILFLVLLHKKASFFGLHRTVEEDFQKKPVWHFIPSRSAKPYSQKKPMMDF